MDESTPDNSKIALLFIAMGGPRNKNDVRAFMLRLFNDKHILAAPQPIRRLIAHLICKRRIEKVKEKYALIGNGSPIFRHTEDQAQGVTKLLITQFPNIACFSAYGYAEPFIQPTLTQLINGNYDKIIAVPLYPFFSIATVGSINSDVETVLRNTGVNRNLSTVKPFYQDPDYLEAVIESLLESLEQIDRSRSHRIIFTAHSLPQSYIDKKGDPYLSQVQSVYYRIVNQLNLENSSLTFQSKIGPVKWIQPSTVDAVKQAAAEGVKQLLIMPLGFCCDHIETLHELDVELADTAQSLGVKTFVRSKVFNNKSTFLYLLANLIKNNIRQTE